MGGWITARRHEGNRYALGSSYYSKALVAHAKAVPGIRYEASGHLWVGYPDAIRAVMARLKTESISVKEIDPVPGPEDWKTARTPFLYSTQGLRDYQIEGVRFLINKAHEGALLADGMRLGKTAMALAAARAFKQRTLVICPSHVVGVWARPQDDQNGSGEIAKWWPAAWRASSEGPPGVVELDGVRLALIAKQLNEIAKLVDSELREKLEAERDDLFKSIAHAQVIVTHYEIVYAWKDALLAWGVQTLILDEAHILSGYASRRAKVIKEIGERAAQVMVLTGTPIPNTPQKLHNLLSIIAPDRFGYFFGTKRDEVSGEIGIRPGCYANLFCAAAQKEVGRGEHLKLVWDFSGRSNLGSPDGKKALTYEETLQARMKHIMLRRLKKDVDAALPEKVRQIIDVRVPANKMIGISDKVLGGSGIEMRRCLDLAADGKVKDVVAVVKGHLDEGEKVICGCYRRLFAEKVAEDLSPKTPPDTLIHYVHGGLTQKERDKRIREVREWSGPAALVCTIDTTSTGIDLSFANVLVVAELVWEPHELAQFEERLYKFGENSKALIQYIIARGTGDELILKGIISKLDTFERVIGVTGDRMRESLQTTKEDAMARLRIALAEMMAAKGAKGPKGSASPKGPGGSEPVTKTRRKKSDHVS